MGKHPVDLRHAGEIRPHGEGAAAEGADLLGGGLSARAVGVIVQDHIRAFTGAGEGEGEARARARLGLARLGLLGMC